MLLRNTRMDLEEGGSSTASPRNSCCARLGERRVPRAPRHVQCHLPDARGIDKRHPIPKIANALSIRHKRKAKCNAPSGAIRVRRRQRQFSPANRQACERARTTGGGQASPGLAVGSYSMVLAAHGTSSHASLVLSGGLSLPCPAHLPFVPYSSTSARLCTIFTFSWLNFNNFLHTHVFLKLLHPTLPSLCASCSLFCHESRRALQAILHQSTCAEKFTGKCPVPSAARRD